MKGTIGGWGVTFTLFALLTTSGFAPASAWGAPASGGPLARANAPCSPLESHLPAPPGVEASSLPAAVAAADRWIRRIAPEACPTKVVSIDPGGPEQLDLWLDVSVEGHSIESHVSLDRGCLPETKAACGGREDDWHPVPPDDHWLATRVLEAATTWLRAHPEIVQMSGGDLGLGSWSYRSVENTAGSTFCIEDGTPWDPPSFRSCWTDPRPIAGIWGFSWPSGDQYDHVRGFVALGPFEGRDEVWAVRFPEAERVLVGYRPHLETIDDSRPEWFPAPQRRPSKKTALPADGWRAIPTTTTPPDLGALGSVDVRLVESGTSTSDLTVVELVAGAGTAICARRNGSWDCAPPTLADSEGTFKVAGHDRAETVPSHTGSPWLLVQRSTIEEGGNGDGSGAGGNQFLEIYRQAGGTLRPLGSIVLGRMEWTTRRRHDGYWRSIARYAHAYAVVGPDCFRIERAVQHRGWADGSFLAAAPPGTRPTRARLPSVPVPDVVPFAGIPTVHQVSQDPNRDVEAPGESRVIVRDFSGLWCLEADRLVRTSHHLPKTKP